MAVYDDSPGVALALRFLGVKERPHERRRPDGVVCGGMLASPPPLVCHIPIIHTSVPPQKVAPPFRVSRLTEH